MSSQNIENKNNIEDKPNCNSHLFEIPDGAKKIAVVGQHGSGKTTFLSDETLHNPTLHNTMFLEFKNYNGSTDDKEDKILIDIMQSIIFKLPSNSRTIKQLKRIFRRFILFMLLPILVISFNFSVYLKNIFPKINVDYLFAERNMYTIILLIFVLLFTSWVFKNIVFIKCSFLSIKVSIKNNLFTIEKDEDIKNTFYRILKLISYRVILSGYNNIVVEDLDRFGDNVAKNIIDLFDEMINYINSIENNNIKFFFSFKDDLFELSDLQKKFDYYYEIVPFITTENLFIELSKNVIKPLDLEIDSYDLFNFYSELISNEDEGYKRLIEDGRFITSLKNECNRLKVYLQTLDEKIKDIEILRSATGHLIGLQKLNIEKYKDDRDLYKRMNSDKSMSVEFNNAISLLKGEVGVDLRMPLSEETLMECNIVNTYVLKNVNWSTSYLENLSNDNKKNKKRAELQFVLRLSYQNLNLFLLDDNIDEPLIKKVQQTIRFKNDKYGHYIPFWDVVYDKNYDFYLNIKSCGGDSYLGSRDYYSEYKDLKFWNNIKFPFERKLMIIDEKNFKDNLQVILEEKNNVKTIETLNLFMKNYDVPPITTLWMNIEEEQAQKIISLVDGDLFTLDSENEEKLLDKRFMEIPTILNTLDKMYNKLYNVNDKLLEKIYLFAIDKCDNFPRNIKSEVCRRKLSIDLKKHDNELKQSVSEKCINEFKQFNGWEEEQRVQDYYQIYW